MFVPNYVQIFSNFKVSFNTLLCYSYKQLIVLYRLQQVIATNWRVKMEHRSQKNNNVNVKSVTSFEKNSYAQNGSISMSNEAKKSCKCHSSNGLHHFNCLPSHLRFNSYVHTGYRSNLTTWECFKSLFYCHNETFNIYSHGLAAIVLVLLSPYFYRKINLLQFDPILFPIHHITCVTCVLFSSIYHLMMCHKGGSRIYTLFIMIDYLGILLVTGLCCITFLKATFFCFPQLHLIVISVYFMLGILSFVHVAKATHVKERLAPVILLGVFRVVALYPLRCIVTSLGYTTGELGVIWYLVGVEMVGLLGGIINLSRLPERWYQGQFDNWFNSHNIMHVVVLIGPAVLHPATVMDFEWMVKAQCPV